MLFLTTIAILVSSLVLNKNYYPTDGILAVVIIGGHSCGKRTVTRITDDAETPRISNLQKF
ncbi:MAG: hypothetical protein IJS29_09210 [Selenomonadaceae bacterium]|nr:hypothetical protein [Selenomonadaceae bacterium]